MTDLAAIPALRLEVKKDKWEQLQNGTYKLQVTVNPADLNDNSDDVLLQFIKAGMGERFMMGVAKIGEDEKAEPVQKAPEPRTEPKERTRSQWAGIRCNDLQFQRWILPAGIAPYVENTCNALYHRLGIQSRKELDSNPEKGAAWEKLQAQFIEDTRLPERH